jgi:hypothetical protein
MRTQCYHLKIRNGQVAVRPRGEKPHEAEEEKPLVGGWLISRCANWIEIETPVA